MAFFLIKNNSNEESRYILENAKLNNITTYVSDTGQVEAEDDVTLQFKNSGTITKIFVEEGQSVKKGALIAQVDSRDAKMDLENAKFDYQELVSPDSLTVLKSANSLKESYNNGWNNVASYVTKATSIKEDIIDLFGKDGYLGQNNFLKLSSSGKDKIKTAESSYYLFEKDFDDLVKQYKGMSRSSSNEDIEKIVSLAYESSKLLANATKDVQTAVNYTFTYTEDTSTNGLTAKDDASSWLADANTHTNNLLSSSNSLVEGKESYHQTLNPADDIEIQSALLAIENKQQAYNDCFVYAPFDGIISSLTVRVGESSGSSIGTIITKNKVASISLNEVDVASVTVGQNVELTFDAINGLKLSGKVISIDSVGTVSSGVVNYGVKIIFNEDDERVKPGMSVNATITTNEKKNILTVSSNAIKTRNGKSYVETFENPVLNIDNENGILAGSKIVRKEVTVGISDDTITEIISGLKEGDQIITKTVSSGSTTKSLSDTSSNNSNRPGDMMGGNPMGGQAVRSIMR